MKKRLCRRHRIGTGSGSWCNNNDKKVSMDSDYVENDYFKTRGVDGKQEHCIGNSCDNLVGMEHVHPAPQPSNGQAAVTTVFPTSTAEALRQARFVQKPFRSEAVPNETGPAQGEAVVIPNFSSNPHPRDVNVDSVIEDQRKFDIQSDYYQEIRRRSLEGRAPLAFPQHSAYSMEESTGGEDFNVALY